MLVAPMLARVRRRRLALVATVAILLAACGTREIGPWKEEIKLSDGRVIVVERYEIVDVALPIGNLGGTSMRHSRMRIVSPSELVSVPEVVTPFRPVILDYDAARSVWFAIGVNDRACEDTDPAQMDPKGRASFRPNYEYQLIDGDWRSVDIGPERLGLESNLLVTSKKIDLNTLVSLATKAQRNSKKALPNQFRRIVAYVEC